MATARNRAKRKIYKSPSSKAQPHAEDPKVRGLKNALPTARVLQFNAPHTAQGSRSPPAPSLMAAHATFASPDSKGGNKMTIMPTPKLIQAIQNLGPTSKPLQVKVINRNSERDEDTSSYESDSSGDTVSMGSPLRCNTKSKGRSGAPAISTADISNPPQEATNASQILKHQTAMASEFPGVPIWFPVKIKRILVDEGCPNALPFKSVHKLTRYRAWLEARRRHKWRRYLKAGKSRWQLGIALGKLRQNPGNTTAAFYQHRVRQQTLWKKKAVKAMRKLDVIIGGINYLDETMAGIFEAEREVYEKYLD